MTNVEKVLFLEIAVTIVLLIVFIKIVKKIESGVGGVQGTLSNIFN